MEVTQHKKYVSPFSGSTTLKREGKIVFCEDIVSSIQPSVFGNVQKLVKRLLEVLGNHTRKTTL